MNPSIVKRCLVGAVLAIAATLPGFQQLHTSVEGLKLIADYEGCRLQPYQCSAGVWTDGIGNTSGVIPGKTITERQAAEGLISNVLRVERALERCVKQQPPQKVYDATVSFAFNVGTGNACSSTLVKLLNQRRWADACRQLPRWVYVKGVFNQGLDNAAGLLTAPLSSLRRTASLTGNVLKTVAGAPVALLRSGLSALHAVAVMFMNPLAVLRGGLAAVGAVLRVLASGLLAMLRVALYAISGLLGALLSPIGLVVTALAGVALVVWKYWQPITAFLGGVVEGFKAAAGPISAAFEPLKPVFQWIGDKVQALWGWFTDLLTPVKSTSAELQSAAAMGRRFGEALAEGLNMVMHPLDSLKSGVSWLLEKLGIVSKEAAKAKLPESVTRQQPATVNADGKVMMPSGGFPSWGYGFAGMYDSGGYIPRGQFGIVGENGPEIVNGPANVTSRRNTAALAAVVAGMMGVAAAPAELPPLHPLALPAKGGEAMVSRAATVPPVHRIEAPTQIIIQTQPGQSAQDIAREVARQLDERERRLKAKARSNYSDQGGYDA